MKAIIVDVNAITVILNDNNSDLSDLRNAILFGMKYKIFLVIGGCLEDEYLRMYRYREVFAELRRNGRLRNHNGGIVLRETDFVNSLGLLKSDDPHIIALARVSKTRLLCSFDKDLYIDFKNKKLIDSPRGKIYLNKTHNSLLH